jgi:hypothetical protein
MLGPVFVIYSKPQILLLDSTVVGIFQVLIGGGGDKGSEWRLAIRLYLSFHRVLGCSGVPALFDIEIPGKSAKSWKENAGNLKIPGNPGKYRQYSLHSTARRRKQLESSQGALPAD